MKEITPRDIDRVKTELVKKRVEFEDLRFSTLDEKLAWLDETFDQYSEELERRFLSEDEKKEFSFLPAEVRIEFFRYFPEYGLITDNKYQQLVRDVVEGNLDNPYADSLQN